MCRMKLFSIMQILKISINDKKAMFQDLKIDLDSGTSQGDNEALRVSSAYAYKDCWDSFS